MIHNYAESLLRFDVLYEWAAVVLCCLPVSEFHKHGTGTGTSKCIQVHSFKPRYLDLNGRKGCLKWESFNHFSFVEMHNAYGCLQSLLSCSFTEAILLIRHIIISSNFISQPFL